MNLKTQGPLVLFIFLIGILALNPKFVNNVYSYIIGRLLLICIVIFFAMNNATLGLLVALTIIASLNQYGQIVEGMNTQTPNTIGEDNLDSTSKIQVLSNSDVKSKKKLSEIKNDINQGIDQESIKQTLMPKDSKTIPTDPNMTNSSEITASSPGMLTNSKLEAFTSYASVY